MTAPRRAVLHAAIARARALHLGEGARHLASMAGAERHARGAHYTAAADVRRVIEPTIVRPWRARIAASRTRDELAALHDALAGYRVLDPACGAGDFLVLALSALEDLEGEILYAQGGGERRISARQLFGIDVDPIAIELARRATGAPRENLQCDDALFCAWPEAHAIIGNPPFQSKNNMQAELGADYVRRVRARYPAVPGRADYCVYWFRRAHDELPPGGRAGLVGTNTIRQNSSREGGLDYVVENGGTIVEAVSTMVWPGEAAVHVSIVSWMKGDAPGPKRLYTQLVEEPGRPWKIEIVGRIHAALSSEVDVTRARALAVNRRAMACFQGQTHGHEGFLLTPDEAREMVICAPRTREVLFPIMIGDDLLARPGCAPSRFVIDLHPRGLEEAERDHGRALERLRERVLPARIEAAAREARRNEEVSRRDPGARVNAHHKNFLKRWWLLSYPREALMRKIGELSRYVVCSRVAKRPIFEVVSPSLRPSDALAVFPLADDYSFGVLQSAAHWAWIGARCSTLGAQYRYTSETVFDTFPWPQRATATQITRVARAAAALREARWSLMAAPGMTLRRLYAAVEADLAHPLVRAHAELDASVREAYGMESGDDVLAFLLAENLAIAAREAEGGEVRGPGAPGGIVDVATIMSGGRIEAPEI